VVLIFLPRVRGVDAIIADIPHPVLIGILLTGIGYIRAIINIGAMAVTVGVVFGIVGTGIAQVPQTVAIGIRLVRVG